MCKPTVGAVREPPLRREFRRPSSNAATPLSLLLKLSKLQVVYRVFFFGFDLQVRSGIGDAEQGVALGLQFGADAHTVGLIDRATEQLRRTGGADTGATGMGKIESGGLSRCQDGLVVGGGDRVSFALMINVDRIRVCHCCCEPLVHLAFGGKGAFEIVY